ncbi:MAG: helix-turn-helix domain-containing protein [Lachnospirales bacterium]
MDVGSKIKVYRGLRNITQKQLAEKTGISEISIRKYESGERNPKPNQLKKIASALDLGENFLLDINLSNLQLETVGDFASILFMLESRVGMELKIDRDENGDKLSDNVTISFKNEKAQNVLKRIEFEKDLGIFYESEKPKFVCDETPLYEDISKELNEK